MLDGDTDLVSNDSLEFCRDSYLGIVYELLICCRGEGETWWAFI